MSSTPGRLLSSTEKRGLLSSLATTAESRQAAENTRVRRFDSWKRWECPCLEDILVGVAVAIVLRGPIGDSGLGQPVSLRRAV